MDKRFFNGHHGDLGKRITPKKFKIIYTKNGKQYELPITKPLYIDVIQYFEEKINRKRDCELIDISFG